MFEYLGDRLSNALKNIKGMGRITEDNITDAMREIRLALLEADVNYDFVKDELISLLGGDYVPLETKYNPTIVMLIGLQGSGKTTTAGKLANYVRKHYGKHHLLIAGDIYRPAAVEQLEQIGKSINVPVYKSDNKNVAKIAQDGIEYAKDNKLDYVIIDTAGRLEIDEKLMNELKEIDSLVKPNEKLLVIDAMMGQDAINVINGFNDNIKLTGAIITKLDGNTKGGVALSIRHLTHIPIKFAGEGEKLDALIEFDPERMTERILDMGDIWSIASKVEDVITEEDAKNQAKKMQSGKFDLDDFLNTLRQIKKLGPLENILKMLPGARKMGLNEVNVNPKDMAHIEAILSSMTPYERRHPEILKATRKQRIAKGSGQSVEDVNRLLKQFEQMKIMMKQMTNGNMKMPF